jgi:RNA polymerase sigma-70 factor, ECF subfamily
MVRNGSLNALKHNKVKQKQADVAKRAGEPTTQQALTDELEQRINIALNQLPEQCRLVFQMSRMEDLKYGEIAGQLNISIKTVENHMGKALRIMRQHLRDYLILLVTVLTLVI